MRRVHHITSRAELDAARASGELRPASLELEGFVHCSFRHQLVGVLRAFFAGQSALVVLELDGGALGAPLRIEPGTGTHEEFPHLYGPLPLDAVVAEHDVRSDAGRAHALPAGLAAAEAAERGRLTAIRSAYAWYEHPEGPLFVETHRDAHRTSGHWLFLPGRASALHRVTSGAELWLAQEGCVLLHVLSPDGQLTTQRLGTDPRAGERAVIEVAAGAWQGAELAPGEPYAFGANVCAPAFAFADLDLPSADTLLRRFPDHADLIRRLAARG